MERRRLYFTHLGITNALLCYWMMRFGITTQRVAVPLGHGVIIHRANGG